MCVIANAAFGDKSPEVNMDNFDDSQDFETKQHLWRWEIGFRTCDEVLQMQKMKNLKHKNTCNPQSNFWKRNKLNEDILAQTLICTLCERKEKQLDMQVDG